MDQPTGLRMSNVAPGSTQPVSLDYHDQADLSEVRRFVRRAALAHGLDDARVERLILAVSELATNTLQHTSNGGQVRVWADGDSVLCEVIDAGPPRSFGNCPPPTPSAAADWRSSGLRSTKCPARPAQMAQWYECV
jgi:anti-sigma regulatory factor (Ser/Thr protein kinase)